MPDRAFHKIRFERLGVEVTLTDDGVPGAPGRYSDGVLDGQTLIALVEGRTTGQEAFIAGKIKADDMQQMRRFDQAFPLHAARDG